MMRKINKVNSSGFSLVELMVVVAIVGILASVAIPNFQGFQRRARTAEAKALLGGLYSAEIAFQSEWNAFFGDIYDIGFAPSGQLTYNAGFSGLVNAPIGTYSTPQTAPNSNYKDTSDYCVFYTAVCRVPTTPPTGVLSSVAPTTSLFTAAARAKLNTAAGATEDEWTINQLKQLNNPSNGTM